jgi:hypothetical protein
MKGNGHLATPWDLQTASRASEIKPGDKLWLLPGTYSGDFTFSLNGAAGKPVIIRPYNNGQVIIDGSLTVNGSFTEWHDIEVTYSGWASRITTEAGSNPADLPTNKNFSVSGDGHKFYACHFHDLGKPSCFSAALNTEFYNCLFRLNGWIGPERGHGHGIYTQSATPKIWEGCVFYGNYGLGFCAYTESGKIDFINFNRCVSYRNVDTDLYGGLQVAANPTISGCMNFDKSTLLGWVDDEGGYTGATLTNNYFPGGLAKHGATQEMTTESGNVTAPEAVNKSFVLPYSWDANRALVIVYNWQGLPTVTVSGLSGAWQLTNIEDKSVITVTDGAILMDAVTPTAPVAGLARAAALPKFGCWIGEVLS